MPVVLFWDLYPALDTCAKDLGQVEYFEKDHNDHFHLTCSPYSKVPSAAKFKMCLALSPRIREHHEPRQ